MAHVREALILPVVAEFAPQAIVLQCGADAVEEDPLSRLALSNNAHWAVVAGLSALTDRYLVLGGGGYNPWTVGRLWAGVWATLNGHEIPARLPAEAEAVQRGLTWAGTKLSRVPDEALFTTLRDAPRPGPLRAEVADRVAHLRRMRLGKRAPRRVIGGA
jgi:acetoin utilization protein AcuC